MSTPSQGQPGDWQQQPQGQPGQYGPPQGQPGGPPPGWQPGPQGQPGQYGPPGQQYGPPPGWAPPGAAPYGGGEPPKKKHRLRNLLLIFLAAIVLIAVVTSLSGGGDDPESTVTGGPISTAESEAPAGPSFAGQQEGDTVAEAGQTITLDDVATTAAPLVEGEPFGSTPVLCSAVTIVNNSDEAASFNGGFDWRMQDPAGVARGTTLGGSDNLLSSGEVAPGGSVTGDVCFDNAGGAPGQYAVINEPAASFSSDRAVWVQTR